MIKDNKTFHILEIIKRLSNDEVLCVKELASELGSSVRTVQRYMKDIGEFFGSSSLVVQKRGCYRAKSTRLFEKLLVRKGSGFSSEIYIDFFAELALSESLPASLKKLLKKEIDKNKKIYSFKQTPSFFSVKPAVLEALKEAILLKKYITVELKERFSSFEYIKPLKILYEEDSLRLVAIFEDFEVKKSFRYFDLDEISSVSVLQEEFEAPREAVEHIESMSSSKRLYKSQDFVVKLLVSSAKIGYFRNKKPLREQKIGKVQDSGWVELEFVTNNPYEVYDILRAHIPEIKLISPTSLRDKFVDELKRYINL